MRNNVKICAVVAVLGWVGNPETAFGQSSTVNPAATVASDTINNGTVNTRTYSSYYVAPAGVPMSAPGTTMIAPGYVGTGYPGMSYSLVNPMGVTMTPGSYYSGAMGRAYGRVPLTLYNSMYVTPGTVTTGRSYYYSNPTQTYVARPGRGLFGRRYQQVYSTAPFGYTYGTAPGTYTYVPAPY